MHLRRLACLLLGAWLAGSAFMSTVAVQNFHSVDRLLSHPTPEVRAAVKALGGPDGARLVLRHQVSEQNRWYYEGWEIAQLILGIALFFLLLFGTTETKYTLVLPLLMIVCVAVSHFVLRPEITALGRMTDFTGASAGDGHKLWMAEHASAALRFAKWVLGIALACKLLFRSRKRSVQAVRQIDAVYKTDYGHVDR